MKHSFPLDLLKDGSRQANLDAGAIDNMAQMIFNTFTEYGIGISSISHSVGPTVVRFQLTQSSFAKVKKIAYCKDKLNELFSDYGPVRLYRYNGIIGVEVPRRDSQIVRCREIFESKKFQESTAHLPIALGIDCENNAFVCDLAKLPHLLISGATGQGKSILLHNIILSLLYQLEPDDLKLVLIDPKQVEFNIYNKIKDQYLLGPVDQSPEVITSPGTAASVMWSIVVEVDKRYELLIQTRCRSIWEYNRKIEDGKLPKSSYQHMPHIVVIIDEFADLISPYGKELQPYLARIAQKARAIGINLIIATLRVDAITGFIKVNFPTIISLKQISQQDSSRVINIAGAETLMGKGDLLYDRDGCIERMQCAFVDFPEAEEVVEWIAHNVSPTNSYMLPRSSMELSSKVGTVNTDIYDSLFTEAARSVIFGIRSKCLSLTGELLSMSHDYKYVSEIWHRETNSFLSKIGIELVVVDLGDEDLFYQQMNKLRTLQEAGKIVVGIGIFPINNVGAHTDELKRAESILDMLDRQEHLGRAADGYYFFHKGRISKYRGLRVSGDSSHSKSECLNEEEVDSIIDHSISEIERGLKDLLKSDNPATATDVITLKEALRNCSFFKVSRGIGKGMDRVEMAFREAYDTVDVDLLSMHEALEIIIKVLVSVENPLSMDEAAKLQQLVYTMPYHGIVPVEITETSPREGEVEIVMLGRCISPSLSAFDCDD